MKSKKAAAIVSLLMIILASLAMFPPASHAAPRQARYIIVAGTVDACTQLGPFPASFWETPFQTRPPDLSPLQLTVNVTASDPWYSPSDGLIVNLTVPAEAFVGFSHSWWDVTSEKWFKLQHYMAPGSDGYGWIFLNTTGDVDYYTWNNDTGVYWGPESSLSGQLAALTGDLPSPGPDGVAGTGDDGFGDGTADAKGSSIIMLPSKVKCDWASPGGSWSLLFDVDWPVVFTTGYAYDIVDEPASDLDGISANATGQPQEFYAGLDGQPSVPWGHQYCDAYITYGCAWSMLNIFTEDFGDLDVVLKILYKIMREDCFLPDIKGDDEEVKIFDIRRAAKAYDQYDEGVGEDGVPGGGDDRPNADPLFDGAADCKDPIGYINIFDIRRIAKDYGKKLTPSGIIIT